MDKRQAKKIEKRRQENVEKKANVKVTEVPEKKQTELHKEEKQETQKQLESTTVYSVSAIIFTLVSAVTVVISMIMWIKPGYYYLESLLGKTIDYYALEFAYEMNFSKQLPAYVGVIFIAIGVLYIVNTILSVFMVSKTMKAANKPYPVVSVICLLLTIASAVLFFVAVAAMKQTFNDSNMESIYELQKSFNIYYGALVGVVAGAAVAFVHMIMTFISNSIWKKTGKVR